MAQADLECSPGRELPPTNSCRVGGKIEKEPDQEPMP
jgi:hypothetical protein